MNCSHLSLLAALFLGMAGTALAANDPFAGSWEGTWQSSRGSHHGRLECIFTRIGSPAASKAAKGPERYEANFHAHWNVFAAHYRVLFSGRREGSVLRFRGAKDLGPLYGGMYKYEGTVASGRFLAHYDSRYDTGTFTLHRPGLASEKKH